MDAAGVREVASSIPSSSGCYQFLDGERILYVGKAVDLRSRVRSYADPRSHRVAKMVARADSIDFAVTDTETQALLLEANLIKRYQPRYNVRLKDDKSYPLVQLTDHDIPRIEITRDPDDSALVFGPYTNRSRLEEVIKAIREVSGLRGCSDHKYANRSRPCLDYDIGLCTAPCTGEITHDAYTAAVESVIRFLEGETGILSNPLEEAMEAAAAERRFERAANLRDRLTIVKAVHGDTALAISGRSESRVLDILAADVAGEHAIVARLHSEDGKLIDRDRHRVSLPADEMTEVPTVLAAFIQQYYADRQLPDEILVPEDPGDDDVEEWLLGEGVALTVPSVGRKATLVELALKNARSRTDTADGVSALADALNMDPPHRIEGFDVSHAQGRAVVGSNVLFVDGDADTEGYRRKKLEETNDDYENMRLLLTWRAERAIAGRDTRADPDLLVIDGGSGQLQAAIDALDAVDWDIPAVALKKSPDTVLTPAGTLQLDEHDPGRQLLRRVRDEAHRFAVQYHQSIRDDVSTALETIDGVGPELRRRLLRRFGSLDGIRNASRAELESIDGVGPQTALRLEERL